MLLGCNHDRPVWAPQGYSRKTGDLGKFFLTEVQHYGGKPKSNSPAPILKTEWWYNTDANGFQVLLDNTNRPAFQVFLQDAFGEAITNHDYPQILYRVQDIGVAIMCNCSTNPIHVICLKAHAF